jgi:hypothetical protein
MSQSSYVSDKEISSYEDSVLFSTSPYVFNELELVLSQTNSEDCLKSDKNIFENVFKLKYDVVIKDIIIYRLKKELEKYELGYNVYMSFINGVPRWIKF